ncbi:MAG: hypothetical protein Q8896_00640 [Bacteroidota bacterium]|nr:hypothetical protein [Bacteroidota bacterium]MDP4235483.1 hypothetical protein [Bacteroidota bacterium]
MTQFPESFAGARSLLRRKFNTVGHTTIDESIQYAQTEYWSQHKHISIRDDKQALGWFLKVAHRYIYRELERAKRFGNLSEAMHLLTYCDPEYSFICQESIDVLSQHSSNRGAPISVKYALGFSLKEIAEMHDLSYTLVRKKHAREKQVLSEGSKYILG